MIQARRDSAGSSAREPHRRGLPGLLFALLVMCLAVVPHVTLAASMMRPTMPGHASAAALPAVSDEAGTVPCHEDAAGAPTHAKIPPCCIVGCGLIAEAPSAPLLPIDVAWSRAVPPVAAPIQGLSPEPAEHPPRTGASIA